MPDRGAYIDHKKKDPVYVLEYTGSLFLREA